MATSSVRTAGPSRLQNLAWPHAVVAAVLALQPGAAVAENPSGPLAAASVKATGRACPTPKACPRLEHLRKRCDQEGESCDQFVSLFSRLMDEYDCGSPAVWACAPGYSYRTLSGLRSPHALRVFGSSAFRRILSGENSDYWPLSVQAERTLKVADGDVHGPGPMLEVPFAADGARARASSTLAPQGKNTYAPDMAFDGLPFTAWCEGAPGPGIGEWLEVSVPSDGRPFRAFHVIPGYAKTQATYEANGAPTRVRVSSCHTPGAEFEADLLPSRPLDFNAAAVAFLVPGGALRGEGGCVRFTILAVREGRAGDTCISEITPSY